MTIENGQQAFLLRITSQVNWAMSVCLTFGVFVNAQISAIIRTGDTKLESRVYHKQIVYIKVQMPRPPQISNLRLLSKILKS